MIYTLQVIKTDERILPLMPISIGIDHETTTFFSSAGWNYFQLFYCKDGQGEVYIHNQRRMIHKGYGFLIYPGESFSYKKISDTWIMDQISFEGCLAGSILSVLDLPESDAFLFYDQQMFPRHIQAIRALMAQSSSQNPEMYSTALYNLILDLPKSITHITRNPSADATISENELMLKIINYMETHFSHNFSLDELSKHAGLTKSYMCTLFKKITGRTIVTELTYIRMGKARVYLVQNPEKSVKEIAHMCGYEDAGYFGRVFKRITGTTPEQYRR